MFKDMEFESYLLYLQIASIHGPIDQLEDRLLCKQEVVGSNPTWSTITYLDYL